MPSPFESILTKVLDVVSVFKINHIEVTADAAELNKMDGVTSTTAELNILDGVTSDAAELNILDGVTADAAELNTMDGITSTTAELNILDTVTAIAAELNLLDNQPATITFVVGAEGSDIINVTGQVKDAAGTDMATPTSLRFYLADDAAGLDPSTSAPAQGISIGTDGALIESVANLSGMVITEADGDFDINLENASTTPTFYLVVVMPNGLLQISAAITFA